MGERVRERVREREVSDRKKETQRRRRSSKRKGRGGGRERERNMEKERAQFLIYLRVSLDDKHRDLLTPYSVCLCLCIKNPACLTDFRLQQLYTDRDLAS